MVAALSSHHCFQIVDTGHSKLQNNTTRQGRWKHSYNSFHGNIINVLNDGQLSLQKLAVTRMFQEFLGFIDIKCSLSHLQTLVINSQVKSS
jgi:hypothetical protein